jgi:hypothetical protein
MLRRSGESGIPVRPGGAGNCRGDRCHFLTGYADQNRNEAMLAMAVHRRWKADRGRPGAARRHGHGRRFRRARIGISCRHRWIALGCGSTGSKSDARCHQQGAVGAFEHTADGLEARQVLERAAMDFGARCSQRLGPLVRTSQAKNPMARCEIRSFGLNPVSCRAQSASQAPNSRSGDTALRTTVACENKSGLMTGHHTWWLYLQHRRPETRARG